MEYISDNRDYRFEQELRRDVSDNEVDYAAVEAVLFRRIRECEELGAIGLLRLEEFQPSGEAEKVERELFSQIAQYAEYDEPIEECLKKESDIHESQWNRIERRLFEHIEAVAKLPLWEQILLSPCKEPSCGWWEALEKSLVTRIDRFYNKAGENWICVESLEQVATASTLETAEALLAEKIEKTEVKPLWEQLLSREEIVPYSLWERAEERLFSSIDSKKSLGISQQPFWFILSYYRSVLLNIKNIAVASAFAALGIFAFQLVKHSGEAVPTLVYRQVGSAVGSYDMTTPLSGRCASAEGGNMTLVNEHGSVELFNGATVSMDKISKRQAKYRIDFSGSDNEGRKGRVAFLVRPLKRDGSFTVVTPEYTIKVTGTYFHVEEDFAGRTATKVLEGKVKITGSPIGDTVVYAGECLKFDTSFKKYRIFGGGEKVSGSELEPLPGVRELLGYKVLSLNSDLKGADVFINGRYYGTMPLKIRLPEGRHRALIQKNGWKPVDTLFVLDGSDREFDYYIVMHEAEGGRSGISQLVWGHRKTALNRKNAKTALKGTTGKGFVDISSGERAFNSSQLYAGARMAERAGDWKKAIELYRRVLAEEVDLSTLRKEDAMFSIAKLQAEHSKDIEAAKESFLAYLALFPSGEFAGESWLRLAELELRKNTEQAVQYYLKFFEKFPRHPRIAELQDRVGIIYMQQKRFDRAIAMFEAALSNSSNHNRNEQRNIASHLYRALLDYGQAQKAETIKVRYLLSEN